MKQTSRQKSIQIIRQRLLEFFAGHCRLWRGLQQYARFKFGRGWRNISGVASFYGILDLSQRFVTNGATQGVLSEQTVILSVKRAVKVVTQTIFEIRASILVLVSVPTGSMPAIRLPARS